jgi:phthalate 4,5-cis-dihydrodiol dehydrogenase
MVQAADDARVLRFGIVGLGAAASSTVPAILRHPHLRIVAAADVNQESLARFGEQFQAQTYPSIEALCENPDVDAVYIATPTHLHTQHVMAAASRGKHVIVEKPLALTLTDADGMIQAAEQHGIKVVVGQSQSYEPPYRKIREIVKSGELGTLRMISGWYFNDWLFRPRLPAEMDTSMGGGVVFRQGAHHFDVTRLIGGGLLRSARAATGVWDPARPTQGGYAAFLEFEDRAAASLVYSGYDHFHSTELTGVGEGGEEVHEREQAKSRKALLAAGGPEGELGLKRQRGWGGAGARQSGPRHQAHFGLMVVSCDRGDIRQTPDGLRVYGDREQWDVPLPSGIVGRDLMVDELYQAVITDSTPLHNARWAKATLEVSLALLQSARERREVLLQYQVPVLD